MLVTPSMFIVSFLY